MIYIKNLSKSYSDGKGIKNIDLEIADGSIVSVIGPNGVGKSTLLNILAGKMRQDMGEIYFDNKLMNLMDRKKQFGFMPDCYNISKHITAYELLRVILDFRFNGLGKDYIDDCIDRLQMEQWKNMRVVDLSLGNKKKLAMIIAFMEYPKLIILDEPTNGIDTLGIIFMKELMEEAKRKGSIVIVSSHILDFLSSICDIHYFMKDGNIKYNTQKDDALEEIYRKLYLEMN